MLRTRDYPREVLIKGEIWELAFVRKMPEGHEKDLGMCDPNERVVYILMGQTREQTFKTVCHELIHAAEHEYEFELPHAAIWKIEDFFFDLLRDNL